jgi:predicted nuclease of predicted toxin-antitoxin system
MICFLLDEDMPRSTCKALKEAGFDCVDVRDVGLKGAKDREVFEYAQDRGYVILTGDFDFASVINFSPGK